MAVSLAQARVNNASASASTLITTLGSTPTVGNIIVAVVGTNDTAANTSMTIPATGWTTVSQIGVSGGTGANTTSIFARVVQTGETSSYTVALAGLNKVVFLSIYEIQGADSTVASAIPVGNINTANTAVTSTTTITLGTVTPTSGLSVYGISPLFFGGGNSAGQAIDSGFTINTNAQRGSDSNLAIASTSGSYAPTYTWTTGRSAASILILVQNSTAGGSTLNISVADTVTTSETQKLQELAFVNSRDTSTTSETIKLQEVSFVNTSDTTTTSESQTLLELSFINSSDTMTTSETVRVFEPTIYINTSDSTTTSENVTFLELSYINAGDINTTAETANIVVEEQIIAVGDATTTSETVSVFLPMLYINQTDTTTLTENIVPELISLISISDTATMSESQNFAAPSATLAIVVGDSISGGVTKGPYKIIFLLDGRVALRVGGNVYLPL